MSGEEADPATNESQQGKISEDSKKALHAWLSENSVNIPSASQDHEAYLSKTSWDSEVDYDVGQWLLDTPQWTTFNKNDGRAVLWLQGPPGCGKSILTARVIDVLRSQQLEHSSSIMYHYCHRDPQSTTSLDIVKSLLIQCLEHLKEDVHKSLKALQSTKSKLKPGDMVAEKLLWTALQNQIAGNENRIYLVIDGLDESQSNASPLGRILSLLKNLGNESRTSLLLSSRFDCDIIEALQDVESLEYLQIDVNEDTVRRDMLEYVTFRVNSKSSPLRRKPQQIRNDIVQKVCQQAQSSFLYASLVLDELKGERIFSPAAIATTLQTLPLQLRAIYEQLLEIPKASAMGKEVFQWIACAERPLSWDEIRSVLAIVNGEISEDHLTDLACDVFIQESCGPLVEAFGNDRDKLRFIHPTVKDALLEKEGPGQELDILGAHSSISMKLLHFLQNPDLPKFSPELSFDENRELISEFTQRPGFGLYSYAVLNWFYHVAKCEADLQEEVEEQLCSFLSSTSCVSWLKGALFMSKWMGQSRDSTALTTDVVESLETWIQNRTSTDELGATGFVLSWIHHFLGLMQDWGRALECSPFWIHLIPKDFIDYESYFRQALTVRTEQAVVQLEERPFMTARTRPTPWQQNCVSVDSRRGLAYTWEQNSVQLSCYHTRTGLLAAQTKLDAGDKDLSSFELVTTVQCPQNRFLALLFRDKSEVNQNSPIYDQIRKGLQPTSRVHTDGKLTWVKQNEVCYNELFAIPYTLGVANTCSLTCVLELNHDGFMRTNLFGHPKWSLDPFVAVDEQLVRWELDDINLLAFSPDSSLLATPSSVISTQTGKTVGTLSLGLDPCIGGCAIAQDFRSFVIVRSANTLEFIQVPGSSGVATINSHKFTGFIHILGISNGGRFVLLLRTQQHVAKSPDLTNARDKFLQDCFIGVFDSKKKQWTPFVEIHPPFSRALSSWDFSKHHVFCRFKPESRKVFETNMVAFECPKGWILSDNVRCADGLSPAQMLEDRCIIAFESEKLKDGFGTTPVLVRVSKTLEMRILYADFVLGTWTPTKDPRTQPLLRDDQYGSTISQFVPLSPYRSSSMGHLHGERFKQIPCEDRVIISSGKDSPIYRIKLQPIEITDQRRQQPKQESDSVLDPRQLGYQISVSHGALKEGIQFDVHTANIVVNQSGFLPLQVQDIVIHDNSIAIGTSTIDLSTFASKIGAVQAVEIPDEIPTLIKSFEVSCQPFATTDESADAQDSGIPHYTIFSNEHISFQNIRPTFEQLRLTDISERRDIMLSSISTVLNREKYIVQFAKPIEKKSLQPYQKEATDQFTPQAQVKSNSRRDIFQRLHGHSTLINRSCSGRYPVMHYMCLTSTPAALPSTLERKNLTKFLDSMMIENKNFESVRFSPSGRYMAFLAATAFVQIMLLDYTEELTTQVLVVLDLQLGTNTTFKVSRRPTLSFEIDDSHLKLYRLDNLGGIRMDRFSLPNLDHHDQQILTFIPDYCCCATCNKPLRSSCHISVRESLGLKRIVLCHSPISTGSTTASGTACEPLILSIASPELPVDLASTGESIVVSRMDATFPPLIGPSGECLPEAFARTEGSMLKDDLTVRLGFMKACLEEQHTDEHHDSEKVRRIPQMRARMSNCGNTDDQDSNTSSVGERWQSDYLKSVSDLKITDELVKQISSEENYDKWIAEYGDLLPATWAEFEEVFELIADDPEICTWIEIFCQDGGIGCVTPIYTHTFYYNDTNQDGKLDFSWTSAVDIGWIEEHAEWFIRRTWKNDFAGARMWYPFEHYRHIPTIRIKRDEEKDKTKSSEFSEGPLQLDFSDTDLDEETQAAVKKMLMMRKLIKDLEDKIPGAGKMFRARFHQFLNQSLMTPEPAESS